MMFRQSIICSANALIIYSLPKMLGVEVTAYCISLTFPLLDFPQTCVAFCVESLNPGSHLCAEAVVLQLR